MNFRNTRRQMSSQVARSERNQIKLQKIRDRVRQSTNAFIARQHARLAWWQSAFGSPAVLCRSIFAQASSLWMAFMSLLGLSFGTKVLASGGRVVGRNQFRKFLFEPLEERRVMAIGVTIDANDTPPVEGLSNGQFSVYLYDTITNAPIVSSGNTVVTYSVTAPGATQATPTGTPLAGTFANPFDYTALTGVVTIFSGSTEGVINVNVLEDSTTEVVANERIEVTLLTANNTATIGGISSFPVTSPGPGVAPVGTNRDVVTIGDNDASTITVSTTDPTIAPEGTGVLSADTGTFKFTLTKASSIPTNVWLNIGNTNPANAQFGNANPAINDWSASLNNGATINGVSTGLIPAAPASESTRTASSKSITSDIATIVTSVSHNYVNGQFVTLTAGWGGNYPANNTQVQVTVVNDTTFTFPRAGVPDTAATAGGTIVTVSNALLTIPAGVTEVTMTVAATPDTIVEQTETIVIALATLKGPGNTPTPVLASLPVIAASSATVTITDDDAATIILSPSSDLQGDDNNNGPGASTTFPVSTNNTGNANFVAQISAPTSQDLVIPYTITAPPAHGVTLISNDFSGGLAANSSPSQIGPAIATSPAPAQGTIAVVAVSGNNVLGMRRTANTAMTGSNQAQFTVNLAAMKTTGGAVLTFDHTDNETGNTNAAVVHNPFTGLTVADAFVANPDVDGVAISVNGTTWYPVLNLSTSGPVAINLERALYERGLEANLNTVSVRILQFDGGTSSNTVTGRQFDNIRVVSGDYLTLSGFVTIPGNSVATQASIPVTVLNDLVVEGTENVTITLGTPTSGNPQIKLDTIPANLTQTAVITDSDTAVAVLQNAGNGNENGGPLNGQFRVRLTNAHGLPMRSDTDTTFTFQLDPAFPVPAATYGTDYTIGGTNVTFNPLTGKGTVKLLAGETQTTITVNVVQDVQVEDDELVSLRLLNTVGVDPIVGDPQIGLPGAAAVGPTTNVSIQDEDSALIRINSVTPGSEPGSSGVFVVDLVRTLDQATTLLPVQNVVSNVDTVITYTINVASTATVGSDYVDFTTLGTGTVTITAGQSFAFVPITVLDDFLLEPTETIIINLQGKLAGDASTILHPTHNAATVNILDNDTLAVKVVREVTTNTASISLAAIGGGIATITTGAIHNFLPGQEVVINGASDAQLNGTFTVLTISPAVNPTSFTVINAGTLASGVHSGSITTFDAREGSLFTPPGTVANAVGSDLTDGRFRIFLDTTSAAFSDYMTTRGMLVPAASQNIVVNYTLTGLASNGIDYQTIPLSATIAAGQSSVPVLVDVIDDLLFDPNETVVLTLTGVSTQPALGLGGGGVQADTTPATVKIVDDEGGRVSITKIDPARESNTNGKVTFTLPAASPFNTIVTYSVTPSGPSPIATQGADHNFFSGTVTFVAGQTSQIVDVPVLNDTIKEDVEFIPVQITGFAPGGNGGGFGFDSTVKQVPILADQTVDIVNSTNGREGGPNSTITARTLTNNVVTLTTSAVHSFVPGQTIVVSGANGTNLNGTFVVQSVTATSVSYVSFGAATGGAQAGTITPVGASFTIGMQAPSTANTVVTYQIVAPTDATSGSDFTALPLTATIAAGSSTVLVPVTVLDDTTIENTENLSIKLLTVSNIDDPDISIGAAIQSSTTNDAQSISVINRSSTATGGIATLTTARPHGLVVGQQIFVSGLGGGFDGPRTVSNVSGNSFNFFPTGATGVVAPIASPTGVPVGSFNRTASAINKSLTSNIATITTNATHGFLVGQAVLVSIADPVFNGTYVITAATATTFSYARTNADVPSASFAPIANSVVLDAGSLPASATSISGSFSNQIINGTLSDIDGQDMYLIRIDNPAAFTANTIGSVGAPQLFLFRQSGTGVTSSSGAITSPLPTPTPGLPALVPGFYYIAISEYGTNPTSGAGNAIWLSNNNIAPDAVGALGAVNGWTPGIGGPTVYTINLTGASFVDYDTTASLSIFDNDAGYIQVSSTNGAENGAVAITFTITQSAISSTDTFVRYTLGTSGSPSIPAGNINLNYANPNGTNADVSVDYTTTPATTYTATIAAGSTSVVITVPVVDDMVVESDTEQVTLTLIDEGGGQVFSGDSEIRLGTTSGPTLLFRQGTTVDGIIYQGTVDTFINNDIQGQSYETQNAISVSPLLPPLFVGGPLHGLIRFDGITGSNLIPANSRLSFASLTFAGAFGAGTQPSIHQLLPAATWPATGVTWAGNFGGNGIQANGVEAAAQFVTFSGGSFTSTGGTNGTSVLAVVQNWVNGAVNNGWAILPGTSGWDANSSEFGTISSRPTLNLTVATSATGSIVDNDSAKISITNLNGTEPGGPLFLDSAKTISSAVSNGTQATVLTSVAHNMVPGQTVRISTGDTRFDGTFLLLAGTAGSTIVYSNPVIATATFFGTATAQLVNLTGQANAGRAIVSIDKVSSSNTFVTYTITKGTADGLGVDYTAPTTTQTLTIPAGLTSATIFVEVNDDFTVEGQEDVNVNLLAIPTNTSAATNDDTDPQITFDAIKTTKVNIDDNDIGNISISSIVNGIENNPDPRNVVNKVLLNNIATITTTGANHTFTAGEQVLVSIGDPIFDGEYVVLASPAPTATTFSYVKSNVDVPSTVVASGTAANQPFDGKFLITTTNASNTPTLIPYSILLNNPVLNNASIGTDYVLRGNNQVLTGTITLPALVTSVEVTIDVLEDLINEGDEDVTIQLLAPTGKLSLGTPTTATAKILDDDDLIVSIVTPDASVTEGADAGVADGLMVLQLNYASDSDVLVTYVVGGSATAGSPQSPIYSNGNDYVPLPGTGGVTKTVTITAGSTQFNLPVEVYQDFFIEGNETVTAAINTIETFEPGTAVVSNNSIDKTFVPGTSTVTIVDETYTVTIARTDSPPTEPGLFGPGGSNGQFTVTLSNDLPSPLVVVIQDTTALAAGKATLGTGSGADYNYSGSTSKFQTVTIQPGQTQATLTMTVLDDLLSEGDETVDVGILSLTYLAPLIPVPMVPLVPTIGAPSTAQATLFDNDVMNVTITATNGRDKIGGKDDGKFTFTTSGITTTAGINTVVTYQVKAAGTTATFGVAPTADYSAPSLSVGTFTLTGGAPGQSTFTVDLFVIDDLDVEGDETVQLEVLTVATTGPNSKGGEGNVGTATIFDDDVATLKITGTANASEPSGLGFFTVEQSAKSSTNTVISFSVTGGTATQGAGNDYATIAPLLVTITAGQTQGFIPVQALDDLIVEANPETVELTLANATTSGDPQITVGANKISTIGINDNDVAKVLFAKVQDGAEGGSNGSFNVSLVDATSLTPLSSDLNVIVTYEISGTANGGTDYQPLSVSKVGTVTIQAAQTSATIDVTVINDDIVENLENVTIRQLSVTTASPRAVTINTQSGAVTNKEASGLTRTLTLAASHNLTTLIAGQQMVIAIGDPVFDGTFTVASVAGNTLTYSVLAGPATVPASTPASGSASITTPVGITIPASSQISVVAVPASGQSLTSNLVTMYTAANHGLVPGQIVTIALNPASPIYDGTFILSSLGLGTSGNVLTYSRAFADQAQTLIPGTVTNLSEANLLIADNDTSTLTINSTSLNEGNQIFDQAGATLTVTLSKAFDVATTWTVNYPSVPNTTVAVSNKELTSNVATLTIGAHTFAVGQRITVALTPADSVFDGQFIISAVTGTTVSYVKANSNVASAATAGSVTVSGGATAGAADNLLGFDYDGTADVVVIPAGSLTGTVKVDFNEEGPPNTPQTNLVEDNELFLTNVTGTLPLGYAFTNNGKGTVTILNDDTATFTINDATVDELDPVTGPLPAGSKSLTAGVATLTLAHGFMVGTTVEVAFAAPADAIFNGRYYVASATTLTAPNANPDVASVAYGAGTVTTFPQATLSFDVTVDNPVDIVTFVYVYYTDGLGVLGAKGANYTLAVPIPAGTDYNLATTPGFGFPAFTSGLAGKQTVTVQVNSDLIVEGGIVNDPGSETFTAYTAVHPGSFGIIPQGGRLFNNADTGVGTIVDSFTLTLPVPVVVKDSASVTISVVDNLGSETNPAGLNQASFKISQTNPSSVDTVVKLNIATGGILNAIQGSDYLLKVGSTVVTDTVTIPAGSTEITLTVDVLNDPLLEDDEFVDITLNSFVSRDPNVSFGMHLNDKIRIDDNDNALLSVTASDPIGSEPGSNDAAFTVSLTAVSDSDTVVSYHVLGTLEAGFVSPAATPGSDYVVLSGTVTITAGSLSQVILVDVLNDFENEPTEYVSIKLDSFTGNADISLSAPLTATVEIQNAVVGLFVKVEKVQDASEPGNGPQDGQFRVTLVNSLGVPVVVPIGTVGGGLQVNFALNELGSGGTAVSPNDYVNATVVVIPEGFTSALVTIDVQDDLLPEPTETVKIRLLGTTPGMIGLELVGVVTGSPAATNVGNALYPNLASLDILDNEVAVGGSVVSRGLFYNNSSFDNNGVAIDTSGPTYDDFAAIAVDKSALLPGGTASFINYTSYSKGINGIIVDIAGLATTPTFATIGNYFQFRVGNGNSAPSTWAPAPGISSVTVLPSVGNSGSTRVLVTWADNAIQKQWLQVIVLANGSTGLTTRDVHYWGNAIGETSTINGNNANVDLTDVLLANSSPSGFVLQPVTNIYDFNRDKSVDVSDVLIANSNPSGFSPLVLFTAPASGSGGEGEAAMMVLSPIPLNNSMPMIGSRMIDVEEGEVYGPVQASPVQALAAITDNSQLAMIIDDLAESAETSDMYIGSLDALFGDDDDDELFGL